MKGMGGLSLLCLAWVFLLCPWLAVIVAILALFGSKSE